MLLQLLEQYEQGFIQYRRITQKKMPMRRESLFVRRMDSIDSPRKAKGEAQSKDVGMQKVLLKDIIKAQAFSRFFNAKLSAQSKRVRV